MKVAHGAMPTPFLIHGDVLAVFDPVGGAAGRRLCAVARESLA